MEKTPPFTLGVVGGRDFGDYQLLKKTLEVIQPPPQSIVSGGCPTGADVLAERYARESGIPMIIHPAEWAKYGKSAGPRRNAQIVADSDRLIAFWDGQSRGTHSTIKIARRNQKPVEIIRY